MILGGMAAEAPDGLLSLIALFRKDERPDKIDVGVGVYRDEEGRTPVLRAVKSAERILLETQPSKAYLGPEGDGRFVDLLAPLIFGASLAGSGRLTGVQTPGGTGALRLAAELIAKANRGAQIWLGEPTWPNHKPILAAAGLAIEGYRYADRDTQSLCFDDMMAAIGRARAGDVVLLHGCCHNPTGIDLDERQWLAVAERIAERGLLPLVDLAYHGLGRGLDADSVGARIIAECCPEVLVAYSCDKNFGLYRERTGALFAFGRDAGGAAVIRSNLLALARANWSMPPDHGAAAVRTILESTELTRDWREELETMRQRIIAVRRDLVAASAALAPLERQHGMFSLLPLSREAVAQLRTEHAIYMADSGRINLAGLRPGNSARFAMAVEASLGTSALTA